MISQFLIMVMQGAHEKDPSSFSIFFLSILEIGYLDDHAQVFHQEHTAENGYQPFFANDDGKRGNDPTQHEAARITHEYLCRVGAIPEEAQTGADQGPDKDGQLSQVGYIHDIEIFGQSN